MDKRGVVVKFIILCGVGINCENESAQALSSVGIDSKIVHVNDLIEKRVILNSYAGLVIPGGFSYGDELGSGRVLALKIKKYLMDEINEFILNGRPILGICNGFQVLEKLGVFNFNDNDTVYDFSLTHNKNREFVDKWTLLKVDHSVKSAWTNFSSEQIYLPIRHGEGRVVFRNAECGFAKFAEKKLIPLYYQSDVNGSDGNVAAVIDKSGMVLGMMPHPECATFCEHSVKINHQIRNDGKMFFESVKRYLS